MVLNCQLFTPPSFFEKAQSLKKEKKIYRFYFNGNMSSKGGRKELLKKFLGKKSLIIESNYGRSFMTKSKFNFDYYNELSLSEFGLCPHQKDFMGSEKTMWTYRFIECCMVYTLPVTFIETPLGAEFTRGFVFYEDNHFDESDVKFNMILAKKNFDLAKERFTLNTEVVNSIINEKNKQ